jgi:uncharacterized protein
MSTPKVVFDTNIFISAVLFGGNPRQCLELARAGKIELYVSRDILVELSQKLQEKFGWSRIDVNELIEGLVKFAKLIEPKRKVDVIKSDPSDNMILECGISADADFIVSGDKKHLLSLKKFREIPLVSSKQFLDRWYGKPG